MHKHLLSRLFSSLAVGYDGASALGSPTAKTTFVTIGTGGITGVYYPTGGAIAKIVNAKKDKYDIRATVESTGASVFNINAIMAGDLEFGIAQADRQYQAYNGLSEWEGKRQCSRAGSRSRHFRRRRRFRHQEPEGRQGQGRQHRQPRLRQPPERH